MSHKFYLILHLGAVLSLAISLGGLSSLYLTPSIEKQIKSFLLGLHGLSWFLVFFAGFGLIAKTGLKMPYPWWIYAKLAVWFALGLAPFFMKKIWSITQSRVRVFPLTLLFWLALLILALLFVRL